MTRQPTAPPTDKQDASCSLP